MLRTQLRKETMQDGSSSLLRSLQVGVQVQKRKTSAKRTNLNNEHHDSKDNFHNLRQKVNTDGTELKLPINL